MLIFACLFCTYKFSLWTRRYPMLRIRGYCLGQAGIETGRSFLNKVYRQAVIITDGNLQERNKNREWERERQEFKGCIKAGEGGRERERERYRQCVCGREEDSNICSMLKITFQAEDNATRHRHVQLMHSGRQVATAAAPYVNTHTQANTHTNTCRHTPLSILGGELRHQKCWTLSTMAKLQLQLKMAAFGNASRYFCWVQRQGVEA